jgi:hypothetical protein
LSVAAAVKRTTTPKSGVKPTNGIALQDASNFDLRSSAGGFPGKFQILHIVTPVVTNFETGTRLF